MARIFDVIEYPDVMRNELVHRFPEDGPGNFRIGSQVIVREGQVAVFFRDGRALDAFAPGRTTITTANVPLLTDALGKLFDGRTPFPAEVSFVNTREFPDVKWGTPQPIIVKNPGMGLGVALLPDLATASVRDDIVLRPLEPGGPVRHVTAVASVGSCQSSTVEAMLEALRNSAAAYCLTARSAG